MRFNWSPGIGDPSFAGWLTVFLYLVASCLCWRIAGRLRTSAAVGLREDRWWLALAGLLLALGINKQLDLQTALTDLVRVIAGAQGWYHSRRPVQLAFIGIVAVAGTAAALAVWRCTRGAPAATRMAAIGAAMLLGFVVIRAASFHHIDRIIGARLLGLKWNWILEIGGICVILYAGMRRLPGARAATSDAGEAGRL